MTDAIEEPLSCKRCGRDAIAHDELPSNVDVFCLMCGFGETAPTRAEAIARWNVRQTNTSQKRVKNSAEIEHDAQAERKAIPLTSEEIRELNKLNPSGWSEREQLSKAMEEAAHDAIAGPYNIAFEAGREAERAAVVKFLKQHWPGWIGDGWKLAAGAIERGEHLKKEGGIR